MSLLALTNINHKQRVGLFYLYDYPLSRRPLSAESQARFQASPSETGGRQSGTGTEFSPNICFPPDSII
jgi:hypothetical protein